MIGEDSVALQSELIDALANSLTRQGASVQRCASHISWVIVTKEFAYKFKKALKFPFLDFSTLQARRQFCIEELRLNRRFSPDLYLGLATVTGSAAQPSIDGDGPTLEYAVKMRAFPQEALWTRRLALNTISAAELDELARLLARCHADAAVAPADSVWGAPAAILQNAKANLDELVGMSEDEGDIDMLRALKVWQAGEYKTLAPEFAFRKEHGFIRECHADLHCANIITVGGTVNLFDCLEFNESLRWIDVVDDISFIYMDLVYRERLDLAARLLSRYLGLSGDYRALALLRFYRTQRALVRSKVARLDERQPQAGGVATDPGATSRRYLRFALDSTRAAAGAVVIMHGFAGSGKSTFAERLVELFGAIQLRSDIERKRLLGMGPLDRAAAAPGMGAYDCASTEATYMRLRESARHVVNAGMPAIIDASFLKRAHRESFAALASDLGVPFFIVNMEADENTLRERLIGRAAMASDPSDADLGTLAHQLATHEPLSIHENKYVIDIGADCSARDQTACESKLRYAIGAVADKNDAN